VFNGEAGHPESFDRLDRLLREQFFRLAFWKVGNEELNYRRFFTVNDLISVRVETVHGATDGQGVGRYRDVFVQPLIEFE
jgi:maltooligosyltrehalose synthase